MRTSTFTVVVLAAALTATPASAQGPGPGSAGRPERPYRGLFGGGVGETEQSLVASATAGGGYTGDVFAQTGQFAPTDPDRRRGSTYGQGSGSLSYSLNRERVGFSASASSNTAYYPMLRSEFMAAHGGGVGGSFGISSRTRLSGSYSLTYQPAYSLSGFAPIEQPGLGQPSIVDPIFGARTEPHWSRGGSVDLRHSVTQRVSVSANYSSQESMSDSGSADMRSRTVGGRVTYAVGKGLGLRLGYGRTESLYGDGLAEQRYSSDGIDAGVDFNRSLSISRRTTVGFSTGTTMIRSGETSQYQITGNARLNYELGRTWNAGLTYNRNVQFLDTFRAPMFSDAVTFGVGGLLSRRVQVNSSVGIQSGTIGFGSTDNTFVGYFTSAGLSFGLTRFLSGGVDYTYYRYDYEQGVDLPAGYPNRSDRQSILASIRLWAPLMQRARRPNASR